MSTTHTTLLQTLIVEIEYKGQKIPVRALFDSGSQKTYIKEEIVKKLRIPEVKKEVLTHSLFGGTETNSRSYSVYKIKINSLDSTHSTEIEALGQNTICNNVPRFTSKDFYDLINVLREKHVALTDTNLYSVEIALLIGADCSGMFATGQIIQLQENGLVAIKTKLGWTL